MSENDVGSVGDAGVDCDKTDQQKSFLVCPTLSTWYWH